MLVWLTVALINKNSMLPYIHQFKKITGLVEDIKTEPWSMIYTSATYKSSS